MFYIKILVTLNTLINIFECAKKKNCKKNNIQTDKYKKLEL